MVALIIEEASDQCSVINELFRICRWFQDHIGPIIAVEELSSAKDMETTTAAMSTRRDEIRPRREVRARITGVVGHWQWVEIGVARGRLER
jgi:glutamate dehydrogenase/leucine dehydrogenase